MVWIKDHRKKNLFVQQILKGDYFGEISVLQSTPRTATVKSSNYSTLISIEKPVFHNLCSSYPDLLLKIKHKTLSYKDPWKLLKISLLKEIDYFSECRHDDEFFDEIHYSLKEENFEKGISIINAGEKCSSIIFIVDGVLELVVYDEHGKEHVLETLRQGDHIG